MASAPPDETPIIRMADDDAATCRRLATPSAHTRDAVCSLLAAPLTLPPLACVAAMVAAARIVASKGKRDDKWEDSVIRFFTTGPWGATFDRLTWMPWHSTSRSPPRCLLMDASSGESVELEYAALPPQPPGSK